MNPFIVFELNDPAQNEIVRNGLAISQYYAAWLSNGIRYELPSNCVWKLNSDLDTALSDMKNLINSLNQNPQYAGLRLIKCIVLSNTPWAGIPVEPPKQA
jgi:hypothetical protein